MSGRIPLRLLTIPLLLLPFAVKGSGSLATGVTFSYTLPRTLTLHEPVCLVATISNEASVLARVNLDEDRKGAYALSVTQPNGVRVKLPKYSPAGISLIGNVTIEPGQSFTQTLVLNEWYGFETPGRYMIDIQITQPVSLGDGGPPAFDPGFQAYIEIQPRNPERLEATLNKLNRRIRDSVSYADAADAATALGYVADPFAVPHLEEALQAGKMVEPIAIAGLERIADKAAVITLISSLRSTEPEVPMLARAALQRIQQQTRDPALKEQIGLALQGGARNERY